jgi:ESS family glutamate:Na+ symporter
VTLPSFLWCLLLGVLIRNGGHLIGLRLNDAAIELISGLALALFLAMTMMALNLASVASLAGPLLLILLGQVVVVLVYGGALVYRAVGRDYESAVMSAAFCGFALGATATAIANMQAIVQKYGPAPQAFLVVPLVGAFLIDLINALVLTGFLSLPGLGG